ncbi:MAG: transketolase [Treponemataceae bacterium]
MNSELLAWKMRTHAIDMVNRSHASHIGAVLSAIDIVAVLYSTIAKVTCSSPCDITRDRIILSKGHAGIAVYTVLAEMGFFSVEELDKYYTDGSLYSGHVSSKGISGVEFSTGSLGHGVCVACGMALSGKIKKQHHHVYAIIGDGENEEGAIWEMAIFAAKHQLSNFTVIIDNNKMQAMGYCNDIVMLDSLEEKWKAFGWSVTSVKDGNNHKQLIDSLQKKTTNKPTVIIANTIKGKGISFMENNLLWHYKDPQGDFYKQAKKELEESKPCGIVL